MLVVKQLQDIVLASAGSWTEFIIFSTSLNHWSIHDFIHFSVKRDIRLHPAWLFCGLTVDDERPRKANYSRQVGKRVAIEMDGSQLIFAIVQLPHDRLFVESDTKLPERNGKTANCLLLAVFFDFGTSRRSIHRPKANCQFIPLFACHSIHFPIQFHAFHPETNLTEQHLRARKYVVERWSFSQIVFYIFIFPYVIES